jgi:hypothetical protein
MGASRKVRAPTLPIVTREWRRSDHEIVRVTLDHDAIEISTFFDIDQLEAARPSRTGITLGIAHLPALFEGITRAHQAALERGLIEADVNQVRR